MLPLLITLQSFVSDTAARLHREEKGATAVEYGLIVGLIAVILIAAFAILGPAIQGAFQSVADAF